MHRFLLIGFLNLKILKIVKDKKLTEETKVAAIDEKVKKLPEKVKEEINVKDTDAVKEVKKSGRIEFIKCSKKCKFRLSTRLPI